MPSENPSRNRHLDALAPAVRNLVQRRIDEHAERQATLGAVLGEVLDDVDNATNGLCACGCGTAITDSSPSAYYASPECQQLWMSEHADNPGEVYHRRDAADYPAADSGVQTLTEPAEIGRRRPGTPLHTDCDRGGRPAERYLLYGPGRLPDELAYRRTCPACDAFMEPLIYEGAAGETVDLHAFGNSSIRQISIHGSGWEQECSSCGAAMLGTVHIPSVFPCREYAGWTLELHTLYGRVRSTVTDLALNAAPANREAVIADTWASMERDLARFEREWRGRLARCEATTYQRFSGMPTSDEMLREILRGPS